MVESASFHSSGYCRSSGVTHCPGAYFPFYISLAQYLRPFGESDVESYFGDRVFCFCLAGFYDPENHGQRFPEAEGI